MEKLKAKHDHTLTDILKVCIFSLFLIMPLLVFAPTALYYGFNEHAQSTTTVTEGGWTVEYKYETNIVNNAESDLVNNNIYKLVFTQDLTDLLPEIDGIYLKYVAYEDNENNTMVELANDNGELWLYYSDIQGYTISVDGEQPKVTLPNTSTIYLVCEYWQQIAPDIENFGGINIYESDYIPTKTTYEEITEVTKNITQMMNENWKDLWQTEMFKWTNTSILKQGMDNFTGAFGVTDTSYITNFITYELIIVAIYIVIDIILAMFKWLTHIIGQR